jgi:hypothetical protein
VWETSVAESKVKNVNKSKKTIEQYCSVCKKTFEMPVVEAADEVIWLKCPGCQGYLPFMTGDPGDSAKALLESKEEGRIGGDLAPEDIDPERALEYTETGEYNVGDVIYHRSWNDYGKVTAKESLPGNRKIIHVHFINQGKIRLLEGVPKKESS